MNDPYGLMASGLPPELAAQLQGLTRQQAIAQALMQQGMQPAAAPQNKGRLESRQSWLAPIAQAMQAYVGKMQGDQANKGMADLASQKQRMVAEAMAGYEQTKSGMPAQNIPLPVPNDEEGNAMPPAMKPAVPGDPRKAVMQAMMNPMLANNPMIGMDAKMLQPMNVGRSVVEPATGRVIATDETWKQEQQATREAREADRRAQIEAQMAAAKAKAEDQRLAAAERQQAQEALVRLAASLRAPPQEQPPVAIQGSDGKPVLVSRADAIGKQPAGSQLGKALPTALQNKLTEAAELADATTRFSTTFKPEFGGKTLTGGLSNTAGRMLGDDTGQSQWWQDYELHQSQVRNKLFGSALTAPEIEAWNKSAINPRMESGEITKNLARRQGLENKAFDRIYNGAVAGGYNKEQIEAFTGRGAYADSKSAPGLPSLSDIEAELKRRGK